MGSLGAPIRPRLICPGLICLSLCAAALGGCATIHNEPINRPLAEDASAQADPGREVASYEDDLLVALSFSGGGTRAAAGRPGCSTASISCPGYQAARLPPRILD